MCLIYQQHYPWQAQLLLLGDKGDEEVMLAVARLITTRKDSDYAVINSVRQRLALKISQFQHAYPKSTRRSAAPVGVEVQVSHTEYTCNSSG